MGDPQTSEQPGTTSPGPVVVSGLGWWSGVLTDWCLAEYPGRASIKVPRDVLQAWVHAGAETGVENELYQVAQRYLPTERAFGPLSVKAADVALTAAACGAIATDPRVRQVAEHYVSLIGTLPPPPVWKEGDTLTEEQMLANVRHFAEVVTAGYLVPELLLGSFGVPPASYAVLFTTARAMAVPGNWHALDAIEVEAGHTDADGSPGQCFVCELAGRHDPDRLRAGLHDPRLRYLADKIVGPDLFPAFVKAICFLRQVPHVEVALLSAVAGLSITEAVTGWARCASGRGEVLAGWRENLTVMAELRGAGSAVAGLSRR